MKHKLQHNDSNYSKDDKDDACNLRQGTGRETQHDGLSNVVTTGEQEKEGTGRAKTAWGGIQAVKSKAVARMRGHGKAWDSQAHVCEPYNAHQLVVPEAHCSAHGCGSALIHLG